MNCANCLVSSDWFKRTKEAQGDNPALAHANAKKRSLTVGGLRYMMVILSGHTLTVKNANNDISP